MVGIDLGERRIGLAVSDPTGTVARPVKTIERDASDSAALTALRAAIDEIEKQGEDEIGGVVVGLPVRLNGTANTQTPRVQAMVARLSADLSIPVVTQDERLSSREAEERLAVNEKDWRKRKERLDAAAAAVILQDYLDGLIDESKESEKSKESEESKESKKASMPDDSRGAE
jgi:putative Holliday junction resolvase